MPRGENPNSRANLKPLQKGLPTKDQRETQRKGAKKGAEANKAYATLTETLKALCTPEDFQDLNKMLLRRAKAGNLKAYELLRDQLGEKPVERIEQTSVDIVVEFEGE